MRLSLPGTPPTRTALKTPISLYGQFAQVVERDHKAQDNDDDQNHKKSTYNDIWKNHLSDLHSHMDDGVFQIERQLNTYAANNDTNNLWRSLSTSIAHSFKSFFQKHNFNVNNADFKLFGKPNFVSKPVFTSYKVDTSQKIVESCPQSVKQLHSLKMVRAAINLLSILKKASKYVEARCRLLHQFNTDFPPFKKRILDQALPSNVANAVLTMSGEVNDNNLHHFLVRTTIVHKHLEKDHDNSKYELGKCRKEANAAALLADPTAKATHKFLKSNSLPTLTALRTNEGLLTADPGYIDKTLQDAWKEVYDGNATSHSTLVFNFLHNYWPQMFRSPSYELPDID
eukprot:8469412-Karenia_brevis.AAC.1